MIGLKVFIGWIITIAIAYIGWIITIAIACTGWILTIAIAGFVYYLIQRSQLRIARQSIMRQLEQDILDIFSTKSAQVSLINSHDQIFQARSFNSS